MFGDIKVLKKSSNKLNEDYSNLNIEVSTLEEKNLTVNK